jgi:RNA polymerase sigma-70 factor (ECF subfamily)
MNWSNRVKTERMAEEFKEKELVLQAQKNDHQSFEKLMQQYDHQVLSVAYQLTGNTFDAEDIYQEVMLRVYQKLDSYRFESKFSTWLYRIIVNCALNFRKQRNRHKTVSMDHFQDEEKYWQYPSTNPDSMPDTHVFDKEIQEQISLTLEKLPMMQRVVFILRFNEDLKLKDIARLVGCSTGTVKNHLFRCTQKMRHALSKYNNDIKR